MNNESIPLDLVQLVAEETKTAQMMLAGGGRHASLVIAFVERDGFVVSDKAYSNEMDRGALRAMIQLLDHQRAKLASLLDG